MKNKLLRSVSLLLCLTLLTSGMTAFAEGDGAVNPGHFLMPASLTTIAEEAFYNDTGITELVLPDGVTEIGAHAFAGCTRLASLKLPKDVANIADDAFEGCENLTLYVYKDSYAETYCLEKELAYALVPEQILPAMQSLLLGVEQTASVTGWKILPEGAQESVSYLSETPDVADVTADGIVTAKAVGQAVIRLQGASGISAEIAVEVKNAPASVEITGLKELLGVGEKLELGYILPEGSAGTVTFESDNEDAVTVTPDGQLEAIAVGTATVSAITHNGVTKSVDVEVKAEPTAITLAAQEISIGVGDAWVLGYALSAGSAGGVEFSSSDEDIVQVDQGGGISAIAVGKAEVTAKLYNGLSAVCVVNVVEAPTDVDVSMIRTSIGLNESVQLKPVLQPGGAVGTLKYSTSNSSVVSVSEGGEITGKKTGSAVITIEGYSGQSAEVTITVTAAPSAITVSADRSVLGVGEKLQFSAALTAGTAGWYGFSSDDTSVLIIDPETGLAEAKGEGEATVTATSYNGRTASFDIVVKPAPEYMYLEPGDLVLGKGDSYALAGSLNAGAAGVFGYYSENPEIATVDEKTGAVTAVSEGTTTVTVKAYNEVSASVMVQVIAAPEQLAMKTPVVDQYGSYELTMDKGGTYQLQLDLGDYTSLTHKFTSDNTDIVTVSETGLITAKHNGLTLVSVEAYNGAAVTVWISVKNLSERYKIKTVMHAMGAINGEVYSNSLEAFETNYKNGHRFFEIDISYTSDDEMVLWHSWSSNKINSNYKKGYVPTLAQFEAAKIFDKYTSLTYRDLLELMDDYPEAYFFMDTKLTGESEVREQFTEMVAIAKEMNLEHVLDRMVIMIYNKAMYPIVHNIHPFRQYVFMMYKTFSSAPSASQVKSIAEFCKVNNIEAFSMWESWWKTSFMDIAIEYGLEAHLHTISSVANAQKYIEQGVRLLTSDTLPPEGY